MERQDHSGDSQIRPKVIFVACEPQLSISVLANNTKSPLDITFGTKCETVSQFKLAFWYANGL